MVTTDVVTQSHSTDDLHTTSYLFIKPCLIVHPVSGSMFDAPKISGSNVELVFMLEDGVVCEKVKEAMQDRENSLFRNKITVYQVGIFQLF